ncbi:cell envelope integrity protein CreD [Pseudomarimonas arenosa]|uniref:Inner membrane CreD family protein n=1 Tax=Pseudomarimonas arenosa TaxID=2774145 RepID=A0AAW3ZNJ9_9GAMM|nr:cell envelope integrity protein CreD [Pseudomarimonas arenosa]MBD8526652.1 inner membrane CreD family protein [Pseudomarimonas arenosa]
MNRRLFIKLLLIAVVLIVLLIPLAMLDGLVAERQARGAEVVADIALASGGEQTVVGPLLVIEAVSTLRRQRSVSENGTLRQFEDFEKYTERRVLFPESLTITSKALSERRNRGPFSALLFHSEQQLNAAFPRLSRQPAEDEVDYTIKRAYLVLAVGDARGIGAVTWQVDGRALPALPGGGLPGMPSGIEAELSVEQVQASALQVQVGLSLSGTQRLAWLPIADANEVALESDWPHPGFSGSFLPIERTLGAQGFSARWRVSRLASDAQSRVTRCVEEQGQCLALESSSLGVNFVDPVDRYLMTERAINYALLMLVLVFGTVFFVEMLRALEVHVMQYGLTGLAMALFFLLLLALSEHLGFALAYSMAAAACGGLIGFYISPALGSRARTISFTALLFGLYLLLYLILSAEDTALLVGALALFGLLAAVMVVSRRFDWNLVGARPNHEPEAR